MKKSGIVLGVILVVIGCIVLLKSFGILSFSWWALWKVWPFIFIFIGIAMMPLKKGIKALLYVISIVACVILMIDESKSYGDKGGFKGYLRNLFDEENFKELKMDILDSDQISYFNFSDSIAQIDVKAEFVDGNYVFDGDSDKGVFRLSFYGANYNTSIKEKATTGFLKIVPKGRKFDNSNGKIYLDEKYSYTINLQGEKSNIALNTSKIKIDTLYINAYQESTWDITFSRLTPEVYVFINTHPNAGEIDLKIPSASGYQFKTSMLSDVTEWNNHMPDTSGTYHSENFSTSFTKIFIDSNTRNVNVMQTEIE